MTHKEIISEILKKKTEDGRTANRIKNVTVLAVNLTEKELEDGEGTRMQMSFTTDYNEFDTFTANAEGIFEPSKTKVIWPSYLGLISMLKANEDTSRLIDEIQADDNLLKLIINHSKITVVQEPVEKDELYINPWSNRPKEYKVPNNSWYTHIESIELDDNGKLFVKANLMKKAGFPEVAAQLLLNS